jgi:hypothetical protein
MTNEKVDRIQQIENEKRYTVYDYPGYNFGWGYFKDDGKQIWEPGSFSLEQARDEKPHLFRAALGWLAFVAESNAKEGLMSALDMEDPEDQQNAADILLAIAERMYRYDQEVLRHYEWVNEQMSRPLVPARENPYCPVCGHKDYMSFLRKETVVYKATVVNPITDEWKHVKEIWRCDSYPCKCQYRDIIVTCPPLKEKEEEVNEEVTADNLE